MRVCNNLPQPPKTKDWVAEDCCILSLILVMSPFDVKSLQLYYPFYCYVNSPLWLFITKPIVTMLDRFQAGGETNTQASLDS